MTSTEYYRTHPRARRKKQKVDAKLNKRPAQVKKRVESNRERRIARRKGRNITGKDYNHGTDSFISVRANRGAKSGTRGDRNARGGGRS